MTWSEARPDVLPGWSRRELAASDDGPAVATLVDPDDGGVRHDAAVLYLPGFTDYFFQAEHAHRWLEHGYRFYGLDLHDTGRSIRPGRAPHHTTDLASYDAEISAAVAWLRERHSLVVLLGHSTGGLIASLWAHQHPGDVDAVVLNSPWFDLNASWFSRTVGTWAIDRIGTIRPLLPIASLGHHYGRSLHTSTGGDWEFELAWKPLAGFPVRAGWLRAVRRGHARLARGLAITAPVLVATSGRSARRAPSRVDLAGADCVLDVRHMWRRAPLLGPHVDVVRIPGGRHDLALSEPAAREQYEAAVFDWLTRQR